MNTFNIFAPSKNRVLQRILLSKLMTVKVAPFFQPSFKVFGLVCFNSLAWWILWHMPVFNYYLIYSVARIALVKPEKARGVEDVILRAAQMGQIVEKVCFCFLKFEKVCWRLSKFLVHVLSLSLLGAHTLSLSLSLMRAHILGLLTKYCNNVLDYHFMCRFLKRGSYHCWNKSIPKQLNRQKWQYVLIFCSSLSQALHIACMTYILCYLCYLVLL